MMTTHLSATLMEDSTTTPPPPPLGSSSHVKQQQVESHATSVQEQSALTLAFGPSITTAPSAVLTLILTLARSFACPIDRIADKWESLILCHHGPPQSSSSSSAVNPSGQQIPTLSELEEVRVLMIKEQEKENDRLLGLSGGIGGGGGGRIKAIGPFGTPSASASSSSSSSFLSTAYLPTVTTSSSSAHPPRPDGGLTLRGSAKATFTKDSIQSLLLQTPPTGVATPKRPMFGMGASSGAMGKASPLSSSHLNTTTPLKSGGGGSSHPNPAFKTPAKSMDISSLTETLPAATTPVTPRPTVNYADRANKGKIELSFQDHIPMILGSSSSSTTSHMDEDVDPTQTVGCEVTLPPGQQTDGYRYMHQKLTAKGDALDEQITEFAALVSDSMKASAPAPSENAMVEDVDKEEGSASNTFEWMNPGQPHQVNFPVVGRICCDSVVDSVKLNDSSILIESSRSIGLGVRVPLDLRALKASGQGFNLFPGQMVHVEGTNNSGKSITVTRIHPLPTLPKPATSISAIKQFNIASGTRPQSVFVASGPYTLEDSFDYAILEDLADQVVLDLPDVVILMGPFVDESHPFIVSGRMPMFPLQMFQQQVIPRLTRMSTAKPDIRLILIPSARDLLSEWCAFPQPPLFASLSAGHALHSNPDPNREVRAALNFPPNVLLFPNPVQFTINEVVFAASTCDILKHLGAEELSIADRVNDVPVAQDRFARLFNHVLSQRNLYPLFPPALDECPLDMNHRAALRLQVAPDVLLLPSALRFTVKEVDGCLCVNPGLLARGLVGGTFAKLCIHPLADLPSDETDDMMLEHYVAARTRVDIVRI